MSKEIVVPTHWLNGGNMIDRKTLPSDHPESFYGFIKNILRLKPEDYGFFQDEYRTDLMKEFETKTKIELAQIIVEQRKTIATYENGGVQ